MLALLLVKFKVERRCVALRRGSAASAMEAMRNVFVVELSSLTPTRFVDVVADDIIASTLPRAHSLISCLNSRRRKWGMGRRQHSNLVAAARCVDSRAHPSSLGQSRVDGRLNPSSSRAKK